MRGRRLTEDAVVVAEELMPSTIAELDFTHIKAVATDVGGWTSHTAIIARGLGIPAVVGLDRKSTRLNSSHANISHAVFCLKKKHEKKITEHNNINLVNDKYNCI